jgi:hypothetical protein
LTMCNLVSTAKILISFYMHGKYSDSWQARYECFSMWLLLLLYAFHPQKYHAPENRTKSILLLNSAKT